MKLLQKEKLRTKEVTTEIVLRDKNGNIKPLWNETFLGKFLREHFDIDIKIPFITGFYAAVLRTHNLITNAGHAAANGRISNQGSYSPFVNIAIGIGTTPAAATDTALQSEITTNGGQRGAATATQVTTTVTNDTTQLVKTFTFTGSFSVSEEGILDNAVSGGTLLARQVFTPVPVVSGDSLQLTHKYQT